MLIEKQTLIQILKSFYVLTGVRIAVFDLWYQEIAAYPENICAYCRHLREDPQNDMQCRASDRKAFEIVQRTRQQYTYCCHAGLYESLYPILLHGNIIGYLMIGQFIKNSDREQIRQESIQIRKDPISDADVNALQGMTTEKVDAIAMIMAVCAEYLCFRKIVSVHRPGILETAEQYINTHLHESISVDTLAQICGISRTSLYLLFRNIYGKSVTAYINDKKIQTAQRLLQEKYSTRDILERIHISDANYFCRLFRQYTGMSLREYRKQLKQGENMRETPDEYGAQSGTDHTALNLLQHTNISHTDRHGYPR